MVFNRGKLNLNCNKQTNFNRLCPPQRPNKIASTPYSSGETIYLIYVKNNSTAMSISAQHLECLVSKFIKTSEYYS